MFDPEFLELMPQTCTLTPVATVNLHGEAATTGTALTPRCHVQFQSKHTYALSNGVVMTAEGVVYLDGPYNVDTSWKLTIPVPGGTRDVKIVGVEQNSDEDTFHHTALHFGPY